MKSVGVRLLFTLGLGVTYALVVNTPLPFYDFSSLGGVVDGQAFGALPFGINPLFSASIFVPRRTRYFVPIVFALATISTCVQLYGFVGFLTNPENNFLPEKHRLSTIALVLGAQIALMILALALDKRVLVSAVGLLIVTGGSSNIGFLRTLMDPLSGTNLLAFLCALAGGALLLLSVLTKRLSRTPSAVRGVMIAIVMIGSATASAFVATGYSHEFMLTQHPFFSSEALVAYWSGTMLLAFVSDAITEIRAYAVHEEWVTLSTHWRVSDADVIEALLIKKGIPVFLRSRTMRVLTHIFGSIFSVAVAVPPEHEQRARELLSPPITEPPVAAEAVA